MKNTYQNPKPHHFVRRLVRQWFSSLLKRQICECVQELQTIKEMLRTIDASIEIIAREIARQSKLK